MVAHLILVRSMRALPSFLACVAAAGVCYSSAEELPVDKFDVGPQLHRDRATTGQTESVPLGDTGYRAVLLVSHYTDDPTESPQFVSISVEKKWREHDYVVFFERQFHACNVPKQILAAKTKDVVRYDQVTRVVAFDLGIGVFDYTLPQR